MTISAFGFISFIILVFVLELIASNSSVVEERKKYFVISFITCIPAIIFSTVAIFLALIGLGTIEQLLLNLILLIFGIVIEFILFRKIKTFS